MRRDVKKIFLSISNQMSKDYSEPETVPSIKICKENRYYYRHREEILARRKLKKMEDAEYLAKLQAKSDKLAEKERIAAEKLRKKLDKEEEKRINNEVIRVAKREEKARLLGALPPNLPV